MQNVFKVNADKVITPCFIMFILPHSNFFDYEGLCYCSLSSSYYLFFSVFFSDKRMR